MRAVEKTMIELFGTAASRTSRVLWALEELKLSYSHYPIDHRKGENRSDDFSDISPNGRIPMLRNGGDLLGQSMAINLYLAAEFGPNSLFPEETAVRAACFEWTLWAATEMEPHSAARAVELQKPLDGQDKGILERADTAIGAALSFLEQRLADKPYLTGDGFSLADLNAVGPIEYCQRSKFDMSNWPMVIAWLARCQERHAYVKVQAMRAAAI
jgi:glutathione S-transferase